MDKRNLSGTTEINDEGIKKHFKNIERWEPVFELVWNGLDARAKNVEVVINETELGGIERVLVLDDGEGIDPFNLKNTFGKFNDSNKKEDAAQHGAHGRGRLAFHRICNRSVWQTKSVRGAARIEVKAEDIKRFEAHEVDGAAQHSRLKKLQSGTLVELDQFTEPLPRISDLREKFSAEFGWYLALNPETTVTLNAVPTVVPKHDLFEEDISAGGYSFTAQVIRWDEKPSSEKSFTYLLDSSGKTVYKALSTFNNKVAFFTSIYVTSKWADNFASEVDLIKPDAHTPTSPEWKKVVRLLTTLTHRIYDDFLRKQADTEVEKYLAEGLFPTYAGLPAEYKAWRLNNAKNLVKTIYVADPTIFNSSNKKQKKVIIRLLDKLSVSNENDSLFEVLNGVLDMDDTTIATLAKQLSRTSLENIVSTIEILQRRQDAAQQLRELMNVHYMSVLETPDLQKIIEANTWLFGPRYETIGAEEDTFTKIAKQLRDKVPQISAVNETDLEDQDHEEIEGAQRQTDLFLARKIPSLDSTGKPMYRCLIIEIKRPSIALNVKHLRQLDDYAGILMRHPEFSSERIHFELILIGRKISAVDVEIASRLRGQLGRGEMGLVSDDPRMKRYVLNWYTLLDSFELSNNFMLEALKLKRLALEDSAKPVLLDRLQNATA
jgi:Histidine kinase-, DNA gyrase B-, and HSP90-like ATPase